MEQPSLPRNVWIGTGLSGLFTATITFGMTGAWTAWYLFTLHSIKPDPIEFLVSSVLWAFVAGIAGAIFGMVLLLRVGVDVNLSREVLTVVSFLFLLIVLSVFIFNPWAFILVAGIAILGIFLLRLRVQEVPTVFLFFFFLLIVLSVFNFNPWAFILVAGIAILGIFLLRLRVGVGIKLSQAVLTVFLFFCLLIVLLVFGSDSVKFLVRKGSFPVVSGMFLIGIELCLLALLLVPLHRDTIFLDRIFAQSFARGMVMFFFIATFLIVICLGLSYHNPIPNEGSYDPHCMYVIRVAYEEAQRRGWDDARFELNLSECNDSGAAGSFGGVFVHRNTGIITCTLRSGEFTCEP
jgi:hypothetical protein